MVINLNNISSIFSNKYEVESMLYKNQSIWTEKSEFKEVIPIGQVLSSNIIKENDNIKQWWI